MKAKIGASRAEKQWDGMAQIVSVEIKGKQEKLKLEDVIIYARKQRMKLCAPVMHKNLKTDGKTSKKYVAKYTRGSRM